MPKQVLLSIGKGLVTARVPIVFLKRVIQRAIQCCNGQLAIIVYHAFKLVDLAPLTHITGRRSRLQAVPKDVVACFGCLQPFLVHTAYIKRHIIVFIDLKRKAAC